MAMNFDELIQLRQDDKIGDLLFVMENTEYNQSFIEWCKENKVEPSNETAARFIDELEYDMFDFQSNQVNNGFFSL